ncbi:MAG: DUF4271 domain-containing protein [Flavobacteriales bacterium]|nr:DUF4271 domain-containing protein [Flavobacteriales bacterium]
MKYLIAILNFCLIAGNLRADSTDLILNDSSAPAVLNVTDSEADSQVFMNTVKPEPEESDSVVNGEILPEAVSRTQNKEVWVFVVCCLTFFLAGLNRRINEKKHDQSVLGFLNFNFIGQAMDRSFYEFNIHQLFSFIVHNLILALWCFYFLKDSELKFVPNNLLFFTLLFFFIALVYLFKFFFQYLSLNILQINDLPVLLVKCTVGLGYLALLISLPVFMALYYMESVEWSSVLMNTFAILMLGYLSFRSIKYAQLFMQFFRTSIVYNIIYFCGLELIPLLVFIKLSMGIFQVN